MLSIVEKGDGEQVDTLRDLLKSNKKFIPFNGNYDADYVRKYLKENSQYLNGDAVTIALSSPIFNKWFEEFYNWLEKIIKTNQVNPHELAKTIVGIGNRDYIVGSQQMIDHLSQNEEPSTLGKLSNVNIRSVGGTSVNYFAGLEVAVDCVATIINYLLNFRTLKTDMSP